VGIGSLQANRLSRLIPPEFGNMANISQLLLHGNYFEGPLPGTLTQLTKLQSFYFHNTNLCEPVDADFQEWLKGIERVESSGIACE
jgi:hypothetical protein